MITHRLTRSLIAVLAALVCLSPARPAAQDPAPAVDQQPVFRAGVDSVSVDVRVTDRAGKPITDLTLADFEIRESGRVQSVTTFKLINTDDGREDATAQRDVLSTEEHARETAREDNRLLAIFLDDYHVRTINGRRIREELADFVRQLTPHDLVALATPTSSLSALTFSRNHDATAANLLNFEGRKYDYTPRTPFEERYANQLPAVQERMRNDLTLTALENLCVVLGGLRDGRKTLLFVSEGLSGTFPSGVTTRGAPVTAQPLGATVDPDQEERRVFLNQAGILGDLQRVFRAAARANTAVYTIDPRGLLSTEFSVEDTVNQTTDRLIMTESLDSLRAIANETDGKAIVTQGNPLPALRQMVRDGSTYYLLGYTSTPPPRDGKFHEIQVRVKRPNVEIRARKGYWAFTEADVRRATAPVRPGPPREITGALDDLASLTDRTSDGGIAIWAGAARGSTEKPLVTVVWEAPAVVGAGRGALPVVTGVDLVAQSDRGDTVFRGSIARDPQASRPAGQVTFEAPAGVLRLRIVAANASGQRLDARDRHIEVPDFTATGPHLSTPMVFRGRTALDLRQVRTQAAPLPAAGRTFSRSERVLLRFQAYGPAGTSPTVAMRLLNSTGAPLGASPAPSPGASPSTYEAEMTFGAFPPGDYVIEVSAESNGDVVRKYLAIRLAG